MYRCDFCGALFHEPDLHTVSENLDGENGWWTHTEARCPRCGAPDFEEEQEDEE